MHHSATDYETASADYTVFPMKRRRDMTGIHSCAGPSAFLRMV
jgi:hypothetical protein